MASNSIREQTFCFEALNDGSRFMFHVFSQMSTTRAFNIQNGKVFLYLEDNTT